MLIKTQKGPYEKEEKIILGILDTGNMLAYSVMVVELQQELKLRLQKCKVEQGVTASGEKLNLLGITEPFQVTFPFIPFTFVVQCLVMKNLSRRQNFGSKICMDNKVIPMITKVIQGTTFNYMSHQ